MKKLLTCLILLILVVPVGAQLANGVIAPDFNVTDIEGKQHHLYSYLSQGKTVIIDFSAAWCPLCWNYHRTDALKDFYTLYGPNGTDEAMVLFIEKDAVMGLADLMGNTNATAGDWITGTPYPIIDNSTLNGDYRPNALPTIYGVYPDKTIYHIGKLATDELYDFVQSFEGSDTMHSDTMIQVTLQDLQDVSCKGFDDGSITISASGPGTTYTYEWNNGDTAASINNLQPGIYQCSVEDNLGNQHVTDSFMILEPDTLTVSFIVNTPSSETANDGSVIANVMGGTQPYSYIWNTGGLTLSIEDVPVGTYSVQVIDANGCQASGEVELFVANCSLVLSINVEPTSCDENADGEVNILVSGAAPPVSFLWNTGDTTQNLIGVPSGGYEVTVTDAQNCMAIAGGMVNIDDQINPRPIIRDEFWTLYLNEAGVVELTPEQVDSNSSDNCDILDIQLTQTVFDCSDIGKQYIEFTVIDNNLNLASREIEITVLDTLLPYYNCTEDITVSACDGVVNYTRPQIVDNCPNGSTTAINGLGSGSVFPVGTSTETYTYTDNDGNQAVCSFDLTVEKRISATVDVNDVRCPGQANGSATVNIENGEGDYQFQWSNGQTTQSAVNLAPGDYSVTVTDTTECTFVRNIFVGEPVGIFVRLDSIKAPDGKGNVFISVFGGTPPYQYEWIGPEGTVSMVQDPTNLEFGNYNLRLTDANGCQFNTFNVTVDLTTPVTEVSNIRQVKINPNPTSGFFRLEFPKNLGSEADIDVYNLSGRKLFGVRKTIQRDMELDVNNLTQGIYLVKVTVNGNYVTKRLIIR